MGTNYYYHEKPCCPTCGRPSGEPRHIGKSSAGWCFALHVYPDEGIRDLNDWKKLFRKKDSQITDEYNNTVTVKDMLKTITKRKWDRKPNDKYYYGYASEEHFLRLNYAVRGPNGLVRSQLDHRCIAHGKGTWDCIVGDFS